MSRLEYKYIVAIVFVFGLFMDLLDMTITNVALPTLAQEFGASTITIEWVVTGYLLGLAAFIPVSGWAGDRFGTKRVFMFALGIFTVGSLLCGLAWSIESLIAFRVLQGVGGGILTPVGTAMLFRAFPPEERARAASVLTIPAVVAPASGPVVGGWLVEYHDWRWIFFINIPFALAALVVAGRYLREEKQPDPGRLDVPGFLLSAGGLASVLYALAQAGHHGFDDGRVALFGLLGLGLLATFAIVELRTAQPLIDIRLYQNKLFRATNIVQFASFAGLMGALFLLPLLLQAEMGMSPLESGLATFPQAIGVASMAPLAGRFYQRIGPRRMMMIGMAGATFTTFAFVLVDYGTSTWWIRGIMLLRGWAFAFAIVPLQTATFATISPQMMGRASAAFNSGRQVAASLGVAILATVLTNRLAFHGASLGDGNDATLSAFHDAFIAGGVLAIIGIAASFLIDDREAANTMTRRRLTRASEEREAENDAVPVAAAH
jgi:EmrB/QacA subfamily drug resistance transporter